MTRAASAFGVLLGVSLAMWALRSGNLVPLVPAGILILSAVGTAARNPLSQIILCLTAFALLARFLVHFFQTQTLWPVLPGIGMAMFAFGFGVLGWAIDRYHPARKEGQSGVGGA